MKNPTLVLTARSALKAEQQERVEELVALGARVEFKQVDVSQAEQVRALVAGIESECGGLHGIVHSAGVLRDSLIAKKTAEELAQVLAPKVAGLVNLDEASRESGLECFILFSSTSGALGNAGQADYAAGNAFMDAYAEYRNALVDAGERRGRTLSVNWPLWAEGGMQVDAATLKQLRATFGMVAMGSESGTRALYRAWASQQHQLVAIEGDAERVRAVVLAADTAPEPEPTPVEAVQDGVALNEEALRHKTERYLTQALSANLKLPAHRIEAQAALEQYGIDSVMVVELTGALERSFGPLAKTLFFEYQTIRALAGYFLENHRAKLVELLGEGEQPKVRQESAPEPTPVPAVVPARRRRQRLEARATPTSGALDIAIIGVSGRYPRANTLGEYWHNLTQGVDCISEVPRDRWNHEAYFASEKGTAGKSYSKWGGFIDGVDQFDPLFFNISPREAVGMDPQERLFLQCVYAALEDAGYTREDMGSSQAPGQDNDVGVFVGVMYEEYQLYGAQETALGRPLVLAGSPANIANRVSYFCNFHGP
ncbi:MAG TPA: SDR family oxidoreductase, partial [Cystobacter sp.]